MISAHYGLSDVFDNLIISLCKFTALSSEVSLQGGERSMTSTTLELSSSVKQQYLLILVIIVSVGIYQPLSRVFWRKQWEMCSEVGLPYDRFKYANFLLLTGVSLCRAECLDVELFIHLFDLKRLRSPCDPKQVHTFQILTMQLQRLCSAKGDCFVSCTSKV